MYFIFLVMHPYAISQGFMNINILFTLAFAITTSLVSFVSYKIYKLTNRKELKLFSLAFLSFSFAYIVQLILGIALKYKLESVVRAKFRTAVPFIFASNFTHMILFSIGLIILVYMTCKLKDKKLLGLLLGLVLIPILFSQISLHIFHIISLFILLFITFFYYKNYKQHRNLKTKLVLIAFIFLFVSNFTFIFAVNRGLFFITGRSLELIAYMCILINLRLLTKK
jgi:hypothetical protein